MGSNPILSASADKCELSPMVFRRGDVRIFLSAGMMSKNIGLR